MLVYIKVSSSGAISMLYEALSSFLIKSPISLSETVVKVYYYYVILYSANGILFSFYYYLYLFFYYPILFVYFNAVADDYKISI